MSTFKSIADKIKNDIEERTSEEPITVAGKGNVETNKAGFPKPPSGPVGTLVSKVGTEQVTLDASTFQFMECISNAPGREKPRYTIVEKGKPARYGNHFVTSDGNRAHVITREVYILLLTVLKNTSQQLKQLNVDIENAKEQRELYKLTVDALRKNGIID